MPLSNSQKEEIKILGAPQTAHYQELKNLIVSLGREKVDPILIDQYKTNNALGNRSYIPMSKEPTLAERLANKAEALSKGNAIIATDNGPRYVKANPDTGMVKYGPLLEAVGKPKLAKNAKGDPSRQRMAIEMFNVALQQNPEVGAKVLESLAGRKYEMSNAKGKEGHHIYPISYSARILNAMDAVGLKNEVIGEMLERHLFVGDQAKNIAPLQTKAERLGPSEYLNPVNNADKIDIHDKVHARAEELLGLGGLPVRTNVSEGSTIEDFISDPNKSDFQKVNYALAVPEAHRVAMQTENLDLSKKENQIKVINSLIELARLKASAETKMSSVSERFLQHGKKGYKARFI